jgi:hypothetical protein
VNQPDLFTVDRPPPIATPPSGCKQIRGTAAEPGTGPAGETCKTCAHYVVTKPGAGTYRKCGLMRAHWTSGPGTDIKASYPACKLWESAKADKPFGHSAVAVCYRLPGSKLANGSKVVADNGATWLVEVPVHCQGPLTRLERSSRMMSGFQRLESVEAYTRDQWVRVYGMGSERNRF